MKAEDKNSLSWVPALVAIAISFLALFISYSVREDVRALGHLDLRPTLTLRTSFNNEGTPTHFRLINNGPVNATQVKVVGRVMRYIEENKKVQMELLLGDMEWVIGNLEPLKDTVVALSDLSLIVFLDPRLKPEHHIFGLRIFYRRTSDMELYVEQANYFLNPDGKWVSEVNGSLIDSIYAPIKKAALEWPPSNIPIQHNFPPSDRLHPIDPDDHSSWY